MTIPNPDRYLDQAEHLIEWAGGSQAEYRRAISTAYYAVFHTVMKAAADHYIGTANHKSAEYAQAYRQIDHGVLRNVCADYKKPKNQAAVEPTDIDMRAFAKAVVELQQRRHSADYEPILNLSVRDTRAVVASARDAIDRFRGLPRDQRLKFLFRLMVGKTKDRK